MPPKLSALDKAALAFFALAAVFILVEAVRTWLAIQSGAYY